MEEYCTAGNFRGVLIFIFVADLAVTKINA